MTADFGSNSNAAGEHPGFWLRVAAHIIDIVIAYILAFVAVFLNSVVLSAQGHTNTDTLTIGGGLAGLVVDWLYYALMESSSRQATIGKMAMGIVVTDLEGQRISFGRATFRYFGFIVSALPLCVGFMMCAWTERKQCLHDILAGCLMFKATTRR